MVNKATILGHLGQDPEQRSTPNGQSLTKFSVATSRKWTSKDGTKQEETEWHNVVCWGRQAEIAGQYLHKGKQVYIEGRLQTSRWEDKDTGKTMYRTEIVCDNFQMLGGRDSGQAGSSTADTSDGFKDYSQADDDDVPF